MTDTNPRVGTDLPPSDPIARASVSAALLAMTNALPRLVAAARSGELAALVASCETWPGRPGAPLWSVSFLPDASGVVLNAMRDRVAGVPVPFFDFDTTYGVASVEWTADHIVAFQGAGAGVSLDDLAFLRDALGELCQAHEKGATPQIS